MFADPGIRLVLTLPELHGTPLYLREVRTTVGVLTQLLSEARQRVVIAAPFMQAGHGLSEGPLSLALEAALTRGITIEVLGTRDGLATLDAPRLSRRSSGHLSLWEPAAHVSEQDHLGSHAKFCVADEVVAYVGSANFTGPGLSGQLEMGLLVHGEMAAQIAAFWELGCRTGFFVEVASFAGRDQGRAAAGPDVRPDSDHGSAPVL